MTANDTPHHPHAPLTTNSPLAGPAIPASRRYRFGTPWLLSLVAHSLLLAVLLPILLSTPTSPRPTTFHSPAAHAEVSLSLAPPIAPVLSPASPSAPPTPPAGHIPALASTPLPPQPASPAESSPSATAPITLRGISNLPAPAAITSPYAPSPRTPPTSAPGSRADPSYLPPTHREVSFAGLHTPSIASVVYVIDASGPMVTTLRDVILEVQRSVASLAPTQKFSVIAFHDPPSDPALLVFMPVLVRATPGIKAELSTWLAQLQPQGRSNPLDGLRHAIALEPEAIFLLSRSIERSSGSVWGQGLDATLAELDRLNPRDPTTSLRPIVIRTLQFLDQDPTGVMQAIGRNHGRAGDSQDSGYRVLLAPDQLRSP